MDRRQAGASCARLYPDQGRRAALSAGQESRLRRRGQRRFQRSEEFDDLALRPRHLGGAVQAVARQGRRDAPRGPDRGRAAANRNRSRRGRRQPVLCVAGRRSPGPRGRRTARGRARHRRRDRLWRVRAVRLGVGAAWRNRAGHGHRPRQDCRLRRAQHRHASQARCERACDRTAVGRRSGRYELRWRPDESRRSRRRAAASRSTSSPAILLASQR